MKRPISAPILKFREELIPFKPGRTSEEKSSNWPRDICHPNRTIPEVTRGNAAMIGGGMACAPTRMAKYVDPQTK